MINASVFVFMYIFHSIHRNLWSCTMKLICKAEQSLDSAEFPSINSFHAVTYMTARCAKLRKVWRLRLAEGSQFARLLMKLWSICLYDQLLLCVCSTSRSQVYETPFFVAVDHEKKKVVISIRGTLSLKVNFSFLCFSFERRWCSHRVWLSTFRSEYVKTHIVNTCCQQSEQTSDHRDGKTIFQRQLLFSSQILLESHVEPRKLCVNRKSCMLITASGWRVSHFRCNYYLPY